jgi:serine/threonine protein phosphatase PrpC
MKQVEFKYHADSNTGLKRNNNEDSYGQTKTKYGFVFVVCDGMGGHVAGERASEIAVSTICEYLANSDSQDFSTEIDLAIKHANKSIWEEAINDISLKGMGTTCVVLYLTEKGEVFTGHVGDSRCYFYTKNKGLKTITKDHSYVQFLIEIGEVSAEEAFDHPNKNRILKALGIDEEVSPDVTDTPLNPDKDTLFLICTDGLNDMLRDEEIECHLNTNELLENQVNLLIEAALEKGGKDNVTVGLLHITSNPFVTSSPLKDTTLNDNPPPTVGEKGNNKKKIPLILFFLVLIGLSYYLFKPAREEESSVESPESKSKVIQTELHHDKAESKNILNNDEPTIDSQDTIRQNKQGRTNDTISE